MSQLLTKFVSRPIHVIKENDDLVFAAKEMREHGIGSLLVINDEGKVVGIITERDLVRAFSDGKFNAKVKDYMTRDVKGIKEDAGVYDAVEVMLVNGFRHLPVLSSDGKEVKGIISIRDLVKAITELHYMQFGKEMTSIKSSGVVCPVCGLEIDEYGYCGCGTGSS
ncbi:MAG: CBS domain-containing protein [Sulfolobaceae archaeon]